MKVDKKVGHVACRRLCGSVVKNLSINHFYREQLRWLMLFDEKSACFLDDLGMRGRDVVRLTNVVGQVEELNLQVSFL